MRVSAALSGVVIAGGRSRRLGQDKRRLQLWGDDGPTLLEHSVALLERVADDVTVVLNDPEAWPDLRATLVRDAYGDSGALGGLATGLAQARHAHTLVVASDMPLLRLELLRAMRDLPRDYDVLIAQLPSEEEEQRRNALSVEPLHAIYSRACLAPIERCLAAGRYQIVGFLPEVQVRYLDPALLAAHDPEGHSFRSINTPEQLEAVRAILRHSA
jgi:molybdenum cofactor guanylyltransferase